MLTLSVIKADTVGFVGHTRKQRWTPRSDAIPVARQG